MGEYTRVEEGTPNLFGLHEFDDRTSFFDEGTFALPQVAGWVIVCGFGVFFALVALVLVWIDVKFGGHKYNNEQFNTAGRSVKAGLIGVDIVSHFTWASILLSCVQLTYLNGVSNSMWFANQGLNTFLFAMMSLELKHRAPKAHTFLEIIQCRWGTGAHLVFMFIAFMTNFIVTIMMVMGAVVATHVLTGVNSYALSILIPMGVVLYAVSGGLKATFTTSYLHTVVIYAVLCIFMFKTYSGGSGELGSIAKVHERLVAMGPYKPVAGNKAGSYLTAFSLQGFYSNINGIIIGLVQIFADQSYWQSAVAASPIHAVKGYVVGTYLYFAIVFSLPICMGLAAIAMDLPLSNSEASNGLVLPAVAVVYFGKAGAVLVVIICFMAVTSSGAGEGLACSSLFTFDVYRRYLKPKASGKELLAVSRLGVIAWGLIASGLCCMCTGAYISYNFMGCVLSVSAAGAVFPIFFSLLWNGCTAIGACVGTILGGCCGLIAWTVTAKKMYEAPTVLSLQNNEPMLAGCCCSIFMGLIVCVILSKVFPAKELFDWRLFDDEIHLTDKGERLGITADGVDSAAYIAKMRKYVWMATAGFFVLTQFVWPLLTLPAGGVWSLRYFTLWVVIGFFLLLTATVIAVCLPIWEARALLIAICKHMCTWTPVHEPLKYDGTEFSHHPELVDGKLPDGRLPLDRKPSKPMTNAHVGHDDSAHNAVAAFKAEETY